MRMGGEDQGAIGGGEQSLAMTGRDGQTPFRIETKCSCAEEHVLPTLSSPEVLPPLFFRKTHFTPLFPTLRQQLTTGQAVFVIFFNGDKDLRAFSEEIMAKISLKKQWSRNAT